MNECFNHPLRGALCIVSAPYPGLGLAAITRGYNQSPLRGSYTTYCLVKYWPGKCFF